MPQKIIESDGTSLKLFESVEKFWIYLGHSVDACPLYMRPDVRLLKDSKDDALVGQNASEFDAESPNFLPNRFPQLQSLLIFKYPKALKLVSHWPNLTKLYLFHLPSGEFESLWPVINSMKSLKTLCLTFPLNNSEVIPDNSPVLGQLDDFVLANYFGKLSRVFIQLGSDLHKLTLFYTMNFPASEVESALACNPALNNSLTHLKMACVLGNSNVMGKHILNLLKIVSTFTSLTYLEVPFYNLSLLDVSPILAKLTNLNELILDLFIGRQMSWPVIEKQSVVPLESVKTLHIKDLTGVLDEHKFLNFIPAIFPNVEVLKLYGILLAFKKISTKQLRNLNDFKHDDAHFDLKHSAGKHIIGLDNFMNKMSENLFSYV